MIIKTVAADDLVPAEHAHLTLQWRRNEHDGVSNHQPNDCLLNRLFRRRSKKISKLRVTGLCVGNSPGPVNSPHKGPVARKMFPFDDVIMLAPERLFIGFRSSHLTYLGTKTYGGKTTTGFDDIALCCVTRYTGIGSDYVLVPNRHRGLIQYKDATLPE